MLEEKPKKFIEKLKKINPLEKEKTSKKKIENLVVFIIVLIVTVILINIILNDGKEDNNAKQSEGKLLAQTKTIFDTKNINQTGEGKENNENIQSLSLEQRLEEILQKIEGVGEVKVLLTYNESSQKIAMYNEDSTKNDTEETDATGGNRKVTQSSNKKEVIYQEIDGQKVPVTKSVVEPKIEGAIIVAKGAKNSIIKESIVQAIEAATGLATHKIQVFEMS